MTLSFDRLWDNYPKEREPCSEQWQNQCAIRVSIALEGAGFSLETYTDPVCGHGHARGAESLANFLWNNHRAPKKVKDLSSVKDKRGIIFFKDIAGFRGGIGDHIDLWNKTKTKTGTYFGKCKEIWFWAI